MIFDIFGKMSQKCEQFPYELFFEMLGAFQKGLTLPCLTSVPSPVDDSPMACALPAATYKLAAVSGNTYNDMNFKTRSNLNTFIDSTLQFSFCQK